MWSAAVAPVQATSDGTSKAVIATLSRVEALESNVLPVDSRVVGLAISTGSDVVELDVAILDDSIFEVSAFVHPNVAASTASVNEKRIGGIVHAVLSRFWRG